jgi:hypothetical protein
VTSWWWHANAKLGQQTVRFREYPRKNATGRGYLVTLMSASDRDCAAIDSAIVVMVSGTGFFSMPASLLLSLRVCRV